MTSPAHEFKRNEAFGDSRLQRGNVQHFGGCRKIAAQEKSELTFYTEESGRDWKRRSTRQQVFAQDRCMDRFLAAQQLLCLDARCTDLVAARFAAECPDGGHLKCLGFSAARKFV